MGLTDVLFGRKKLKGPAQERLFALSTARVTLDAELGLKPAGAGGVIFKPLSAGGVVPGRKEAQQGLDAGARGDGAGGRGKKGEVGAQGGGFPRGVPPGQ